MIFFVGKHLIRTNESKKYYLKCADGFTICIPVDFRICRLHIFEFIDFLRKDHIEMSVV